MKLLAQRSGKMVTSQCRLEWNNWLRSCVMGCPSQSKEQRSFLPSIQPAPIQRVDYLIEVLKAIPLGFSNHILNDDSGTAHGVTRFAYAKSDALTTTGFIETIQILKGLPCQRTEATLAHEFIHAWLCRHPMHSPMTRESASA
eukprot:Protomagalhaensia_wolfi_Nauph_80__686@NODE_1392_length_1547_cov_13_842175_g1077_i0_p2_GENE_NODE_1392_length_1547_cov_13_842175_g1077_i0NODE_1392_length_1547_cov_13_842175_g1077_i0_p2_ORF_typecomplete_len143_score10_45DA1like/PF12315_8/1_7e07SprTlike/PF10263_9/0_0019Peptidase_M78/PF06114_13/0_081NDUFA12/PF05071_16/0_85NDUFA12/PF05071_16/1_6e03_NODE_1392_length_1547_cov_13_842175_g1077_i011191547